jgi:hypothetical protein
MVLRRKSRVLVCGDRHWTNREAIRRVLQGLIERGYDDLIHGGAKGVDTLAGEVWKYDLKQSEPWVFKAEWSLYGRAAGPIRNQRMLDEGKPDLVVAFHNDLPKSKGTKDMVKRAQKADVPVLLYNEQLAADLVWEM